MDALKATPIPHTKQDDTALDNLHEILKQSADGNNKIRINEFKSPSFYLPAIGNTSELLDFPSTQKQLLDLFETAYETPLNISRTSKFEFFNKGVGLRTVGKIIGWFKTLPLPFDQLATKRLMAKVIRSNKVGSNAGNWFSAIKNFEAGFQNTSESKEHELGPLFDFILHRCNTDIKFLTLIRQQIKKDKIDTTDVAGAWKLQQPLWSDNSKVPDSALQTFEQHAEKLAVQPKSLTKQQTLDIAESYCHLCLDFYLEAITHYEIGCRFYYGKDPEKQKKELGMITKAILAYATDDNIKTCFDGMLTELKEVTSELVNETSYRKLASFIEIDEEEPGESLEDKQYKQLKDWRNGRNLPSGKKLITFLQNLDEYIDTNSGFVTFLMCRIAMGMDKLVNGVLTQSAGDNCNSDDVEIIIKKVLARIPEYYMTNLKGQLDKRESIT